MIWAGISKILDGLDGSGRFRTYIYDTVAVLEQVSTTWTDGGLVDGTVYTVRPSTAGLPRFAEGLCVCFPSSPTR